MQLKDIVDKVSTQQPSPHHFASILKFKLKFYILVIRNADENAFLTCFAHNESFYLFILVPILHLQ